MAVIKPSMTEGDWEIAYEVVLGGLCELLLSSISKARVCEVVSKLDLRGA